MQKVLVSGGSHSILQCHVLGWRIDQKKIDAELEKYRKTFSTQDLPGGKEGLFDPDTASEEQIRKHEEMLRANEIANIKLQEEVKQLGMRIAIDMADVCGLYKDEVSLLNWVSQSYLQCTPDYNLL